MLRSIFWSMATIAIVLLGWIAIPSGMFYRPVSWSYDERSGRATLHRVVNLPNIFRVSWAAEIYGPDGFVCHADGIRFAYPSQTIYVEIIDPALKQCADVKDSVGIFSFSVLAFGFIPLRPVYLYAPPDYVGGLPK